MPRCSMRSIRVTSCASISAPKSRGFSRATSANSAMRSAALQPTGKATRLGDCLRTVLSDQGLSGVAAVVLMTDGITTDGQRLVGQAAPPRRFERRRQPSRRRRRGRRRPRQGHSDVCHRAWAAMQPLQDLELSDLQVSDVAFVDDMLTFRFNLIATGYAGKQVEVRLKDKKSGAVLARQTVTIRRQPQAAGTDVVAPARQSGPIRLRRRSRSASGRSARRQQSARAASQRSQGPDSRAAGASLSELRIPLSEKSAGARHDDRAAFAAARCRRGIRLGRQDGPRGVSRSAARICSTTTW